LRTNLLEPFIIFFAGRIACYPTGKKDLNKQIGDLKKQMDNVIKEEIFIKIFCYKANDNFI
jgi:hypothetical protein